MPLTKEEKAALEEGRRRIERGELLRSRAGVPPENVSEAIKKRVSNFLVKYINSKKVSIDDLAKNLGIEKRELDKILAYHVKDFSLDLAVECLDILMQHDHDVSFDDLLPKIDKK